MATESKRFALIGFGEAGSILGADLAAAGHDVAMYDVLLYSPSSRTQMRVKARLGQIDWALVEEAQRTGRPISADLSGRGPGAGRTPIDWRLEPLGM